MNFLSPQEIMSVFNVTDLNMHEYTYKTTSGGIIFVSASCVTDLTNDYGSIEVDIIHGATRLARDDLRTDVNSSSYRGASAAAVCKSLGANLYIKFGSTIGGSKEVCINIVAFGCTVTKI